MKKALIAMSGGVDSSVTAYIMKNSGYDCVGVTFKMFDKSNRLFGFTDADREKDVKDAQDVCNTVGIPFEAIDASGEFRRRVIDNFVSVYENGGTPNPCVECNRHIKFELLAQFAEKYGCDVIATGHYAKKLFNAQNGRYYVSKADDTLKDQSYVLWRLTQRQLEKTVFPLGSMTKDEVRAIAAANGFVNAGKSDSQDICFIGDGDYTRFVREYTGKDYPFGDFVDTSGGVLGRHRGIIGYTVGQRRGLELPFGKRIYVKEKNAEKNEIVLSSDSELYEKTVRINSVNVMMFDESDFYEPKRCFAKIRYSKKQSAATAIFRGNGEMTLIFDESVRAPTKGQSAVLYDENSNVLAGGVIV